MSFQYSVDIEGTIYAARDGRAYSKKIGGEWSGEPDEATRKDLDVGEASYRAIRREMERMRQEKYRLEAQRKTA